MSIVCIAVGRDVVPPAPAWVSAQLTTSTKGKHDCMHGTVRLILDCQRMWPQSRRGVINYFIYNTRLRAPVARDTNPLSMFTQSFKLRRYNCELCVTIYEEN